jgi:hypothetical protein
MAFSGWYLDGTRIYVQEIHMKKGQVIARLQPLNSTTVLQVFGEENPIRKLKVKIAGVTDRDAIEALVDGDDVTLTGPYDSGDYKIKDFSSVQTPIYYQSVRPDLDDDAPIYDCEIELYE